ncbi:MAG: response regulator [Micavibrio aeruginosavorus]|uniref:Response regulator n=1 Tax=Micavibrio aeruginosavorus TaxID=349221 RepID=A0A2W5N7T2_9BACT|nr:MAG: response regulator [Micavibrio aeruginosavorus]
MGISGDFMKIISDGAEHQFLTFIDKLKANPSGWIACVFPFSRHVVHDNLVSRRAFIKSDLTRFRAEAKAYAEELRDTGGMLPGAQLYFFTDNDVILLCCPANEAQQKQVRQTLEAEAAKFPRGFCEFGFLAKELPTYQKMAEQKFLSHKKMKAYDSLSDESVVESLSLRRKRREEPIILVVEDDRFTASYIAGFLKEFDIVIARNGEEAIQKYIEYAPDAVFLDIHLPGINGHQTLQAIKCADPEAFVVMLSVDTAKSSIMNASELGAVSFLKKPFSRERVLNTLRLSPFIRDSRGILPIQRV